MATQANIVIADGASTPVNHTFVPANIAGNVSTWNGPGSTLATRERLVVTVRAATATQAGKVNIKLTTPTEKTVDGVIVPAYQELFSGDFVLAPGSVAQNRKDLRVLVSNLLKDPQIIDLIDNGNGVS